MRLRIGHPVEERISYRADDFGYQRVMALAARNAMVHLAQSSRNAGAVQSAVRDQGWNMMGGSSKTWDGELVRKWLESRFEAARLEQAVADKRGYEAQDDHDKAAAEEWVCRILKTTGRTDDQAAFAAQIKELLAQDEYRITGIHDDQRFDRHVRANLRKIAKMTKANDGFANTLRYQG